MMWVIAVFLFKMSSVTSGRERILTLNALNPNGEFHTPTILRTHWARAFYSWHVSAPGNVAQITLSCVIDIIETRNCSTASFSFYDYDDKITFCGRRRILRTLDGSTNLFIFKSSMCINLNYRGVSCRVSYNPDDIQTDRIPVDPDCRCGEKGLSRIVGGMETAPNQYTWQALLRLKLIRPPFCGGSVIGEKWVLSASHCVINKTSSSIFVVLGEYDYAQSSQLRQHFEVSEIIMHENYSEITENNDIALLNLMRSVTFNDYISQICLPFNYKYYDFTDKTGTMTGWGQTIMGDIHSNSKILKEIDQKIIMPSKCTWLDGYRWTRRDIYENMICALAKNGGIREGDSGGPLVWESDSSNLYFQVGVGSFFANLTDNKDPNVYARVSQFLEWIVEKAGAENEFCVKE